MRTGSMPWRNGSRRRKPGEPDCADARGRASGNICRDRRSERLAPSDRRKRLLGLLGTDASVLDGSAFGQAGVQRRDIALEDLPRDQPVFEDIDLALDYGALGFTDERDPRRAGISRSKRSKILDEMISACQRYIGSEFLDALKARCREILGAEGAWSLDVSEADPNVVRFRYPAAAGRRLPTLLPR